MARSTLICLVTATFASFACPSGASAQATAPQSSPSPILAPAAGEKAPSNAPKRNRVMSSEVAAALAAASPKYTPPPPPKPAPKPEEQLPDLRDTDKPKNEIIRLPKYLVREAKPAVLKETDVLTNKGLTDVAMRRYISDADRALNRFTLPLFGTSKEARAREMYAEDDRLRNMSELEDNAKDAFKTDSEAGSYIRKEAQKTYLRSSDFGWTSGPPK